MVALWRRSRVSSTVRRMLSYRTYFDVARDGFADWNMVRFPLLIGLAWILLNFVSRILRKRNPFDVKALLGYLGVLVLTSYVAIMMYRMRHGEYERMRDAELNGGCEWVEGTVANMQPEEREGAVESFVVSGHRYSYGSHGIGPGFHLGHASGGPMKNGLQVRICDVGGAIARLEIAD